jgi:hypothetical protein
LVVTASQISESKESALPRPSRGRGTVNSAKSLPEKF